MASVLLIDPQEDFTIPLADALRQKGHVITTISDGKEGVDHAQKDRPDAIVLSVEQRGMNGLSICARLRRDDSTRSIPVVLVSVDATSFAMHRSSKSKADAYMAKPFSAIELLGVLNSLIERPRDGMTDVEIRSRAKTQRPGPPPPSPVLPSNGHSIADLLARDLPSALQSDESGAELDWMVKLRQSIARRDTQIADLRAKVEEAARMQTGVLEKERRHQEELQKISRERDETVKSHMSMQEKLTSTRLDLDDTKKRFAKEKKTLEDRLAQLTKQGEERAASLQKQMEDKLSAQKKQSDDVIAAMKHQLDELGQRESQKTASLEAANRQLKSVSQKLDETTRNFETAKKNASDLKSQNEKQANRIAQLEDELRRAHHDLEQKGQAISKLEDQAAKAEADHAKELLALREDLKAAHAGSEAKSKTILMREDELAKQKANYEKRLASQDDSLRKMTAALDTKTVQHTKDLEVRDSSIAGLKQKITTLQSDAAREHAEHEKLLQVAAELNAKELNRVREEQQALLMQVEQQHREAQKKLAAEKELAEMERSAIEAQVVDLGKRLAPLEKQLAQTRQQLTEQEKRTSELAEKLGAAEGRNAELERFLGEARRSRKQVADALLEIVRLAESSRTISPVDE